MPFPAFEGVVQTDVSRAWNSARVAARNVRDRAVTLNALALNPGAGSSVIKGYATYLADARLTLMGAANTGGIVEYARLQINNPARDVTVEFNTMVAAMDAVVSWIITNFPKGTGSFLLAETFATDNSGRTQDRLFTPADLAALRPLLDTLIASIA
jgi:hypothetical protein